MFANAVDNLGELNLAGHADGPVPVDVPLVRRDDPLLPFAGSVRAQFGRCQRRNESLRACIDGEIGLVDVAQFVGVGMHVDQALPGTGDIDQTETGGRHFTEPRADHQQAVGFVDELVQGGIGTETEIAGIVGMFVIDKVLAAKRIHQRNRTGGGELLQLQPRRFAPAAATDDDQRALGFGE